MTTEQHNNKANVQNDFFLLPLGFEATEMERFSKIFEQASHAVRRYVLVSVNANQAVHALLVNYDNAAALAEKTAVVDKQGQHIHVVAVSRGPLIPEPEHHIRGLITAARLLATLDKIPDFAPVLLPQLKSAPMDEKPPAGKAGFRVLVVDDSLAIQKSLALKLSELTEISEIDFAESGEESLQKAENKHYDLIFLDVMMPGIDGYETCTCLRKQPAYKKTPIIMVSGKSSPLDEVKGVIAGCTTYLTKPVEDEAFKKLSCRILDWLVKYQTNNSH